METGQPIQARLSMRGLNVPQDALWPNDIAARLLRFPAGVHDVQVDALGLIGQLLDKLWTPSAAKSRTDGIPDDRYGKRRRFMTTGARSALGAAFETMQQGEGRLDAFAGRAGVVGGPHIENNGSVSVVVQKPGQETNVRTSASGNLFKDVVPQRGRTMATACGG